MLHDISKANLAKLAKWVVASKLSAFIENKKYLAFAYWCIFT